MGNVSKVGYSGRTGKAGTGYLGRPSSGVSMGDLWNYAKKMSQVKQYQIQQKKSRPYERQSPLEKATYSIINSTSEPGYHKRIINLAAYKRNLDNAYKRINNSGYELKTEYKAA